MKIKQLFLTLAMMVSVVSCKEENHIKGIALYFCLLLDRGINELMRSLIIIGSQQRQFCECDENCAF